MVRNACRLARVINVRHWHCLWKEKKGGRWSVWNMINTANLSPMLSLLSPKPSTHGSIQVIIRSVLNFNSFLSCFQFFKYMNSLSQSSGSWPLEGSSQSCKMTGRETTKLRIICFHCLARALTYCGLAMQVRVSSTILEPCTSPVQVSVARSFHILVLAALRQAPMCSPLSMKGGKPTNIIYHAAFTSQMTLG